MSRIIEICGDKLWLQQLMRLSHIEVWKDVDRNSIILIYRQDSAESWMSMVGVPQCLDPNGHPVRDFWSGRPLKAWVAAYEGFTNAIGFPRMQSFHLEIYRNE